MEIIEPQRLMQPGSSGFLHQNLSLRTMGSQVTGGDWRSQKPAIFRLKPLYFGGPQLILRGLTKQNLTGLGKGTEIYRLFLTHQNNIAYFHFIGLYRQVIPISFFQP